MKNRLINFAFAIPFAFAGSVFAGSAYTACKLPDANTVHEIVEDVQDVLSVVEIACVLGHDQIGDENVIAKFCNIAQKKAPVVRKLLDSPDVQELFAAKRAMNAAKADAGVKDAAHE